MEHLRLYSSPYVLSIDSLYLGLRLPPSRFSNRVLVPVTRLYGIFLCYGRLFITVSPTSLGCFSHRNLFVDARSPSDWRSNHMILNKRLRYILRIVWTDVRRSTNSIKMRQFVLAVIFIALGSSAHPALNRIARQLYDPCNQVGDPCPVAPGTKMCCAGALFVECDDYGYVFPSQCTSGVCQYVGVEAVGTCVT